MIKQIETIWNIEDILGFDESLTEKQASKVLEYLQDNFNAEYGINWGVIEAAIAELYPDKTYEIKATTESKEEAEKRLKEQSDLQNLLMGKEG